MQLKWIAIDDEPLALQLVRQYAQRFAELQLVQTFDDAITGAEFLRQHAIDLLFIDINMPDITGLDVVRSLAKKPLLIFTTAYKQFALDGFELDAVDYLVKPIAPERFDRAVQKAIERFKYTNVAPTANESLFVRSGYELVKVPLADIVFIESLEDYLKIHRLNGKPVMTLMTVKAVLEKLPPRQFIRIHRSYIVAVSHVQSVANRKVRVPNGELPVSDRYAGFIAAWKNK